MPPRIVGRGEIAVPHIKPATLASHLQTAWQAEPGDSVADVLNAITRAAHEQADAWQSPWSQNDLEEKAGQLLYQNAHVLPALTASQLEAIG